MRQFPGKSTGFQFTARYYRRKQMSQNANAVENATVQDITELAWEDLVMEMDEETEVPTNSTGSAFTFTYDNSGQCDH
jgi:hypothetical protein